VLVLQVPSPSHLTAVEDDVRTQADAVRVLKVQEGLSNKVRAAAEAAKAGVQRALKSHVMDV